MRMPKVGGLKNSLFEFLRRYVNITVKAIYLILMIIIYAAKFRIIAN